MSVQMPMLEDCYTGEFLESKFHGTSLKAGKSSSLLVAVKEINFRYRTLGI